MPKCCTPSYIVNSINKSVASGVADIKLSLLFIDTMLANGSLN